MLRTRPLRARTRRGTPGEHRRRIPALLGAGFLGFALLVTSAAAQEGNPELPQTGTLRISDAVRQALSHHPSVDAARAATVQAAKERDEAKAALMPNLDLAVQATHYQEPMLVIPLHGFDPGTVPLFDRTLIQGGPSVSYTVFDGGARRARIRQTDAGVGAAEAAERTVVLALTARVVAGYLDVLGKARVLEAHQQRIAALEAEAQRVQQLRSVGRAAELERLRVQAALASAEAERELAASAVDLAERDLARLLGVRVEETRAGRLVPVRFAPFTADREAVLAAAIRGNPDLEAARRRARTAEAAVGIARSTYLPRVGVVGTYLSRGTNDDRPDGEWSAGVQLAIPIYTGGARSSRVAQARAAVSAAESQTAATELEVAREVDRALARVRETASRIASLEAAVAAYEEVVRTERLALTAGAGVQTDYLRATADLLGAQASLAEVRFAALAARAEVARVTGELNPEWISNMLEVER